MKNLKTFESFKINELQDMFTLPIDVVEQTGKELEKLRPHFNELISDLRTQVEQNFNLRQEDLSALQEFLNVYAGGIEPRLNFDTIKRMALEINKNYHTSTNENSQEDDDELDDFDTEMFKGVTPKGSGAQEYKAYVRRRLKKKGLSDEEIHRDFPNLRKEEVKNRFTNFVKRLFANIFRGDRIVTAIMLVFSIYLSRVTGQSLTLILLKQLGILVLAFILAAIVIVMYELLKRRLRNNS